MYAYTLYIFSNGTESQQSDEVDILEVSEESDTSVPVERNNVDLEVHNEAEEFDTDLPAEHNVRI